MSLMIGVISYLPDDEKLRLKRINARKKQAKWLKETFDIPVTVIAQNYKNDIISNENTISFDRPLQPGNARNVLIEKFNQSNYDHLMILDDDVAIYDYYDAYEFIKDLDKNPEKYKDIDVVLPSVPHIDAFKKSMYEDKRNITDFKFVRKSPLWTTQIIVINRKVVEKQLKYDEVNCHLAEDYDFIIRLFKEHFRVYVASFLQLKSYCSLKETDSTLYKNTIRKEIEKENYNKLAKRYNVPEVNGRKMYSKLLESWGVNYSKIVYISRPANYIFPDNLIIKEEKKGVLF